MNTIDIPIIIQIHITIEDILVYIGTLLIGFEFVRKINRLEVILVLISALPLSPLLNAFPTTPEQKARFKWHNVFKSFSPLKIVYTIILLIFLSPLSLMSLLFFIFTEFVNDVDKLLNKLWNRLITKYEQFSRKLVGILIQRVKRYRGLSSRVVVEAIKNEKIPFLPAIGIILIIISLLMRIF